MAKKLDPEEKELLNLFENNKLKRSKDAEKEMAIAKLAAAAHIKKDARINIRMSRFDLDRLKRIAVSEGLPYQTLISSVLHKFIKNTSVD